MRGGSRERERLEDKKKRGGDVRSGQVRDTQREGGRERVGAEQAHRDCRLFIVYTMY